MSAPGLVPVAARPAAAVVLLRDGQGGGVEVFMVRRHIRSEFVPDAYVFPGGTVKLNDAETERTPGLCAPVGQGATALGSGFRAAAIRECFEEAGVLLARRGDDPLSIGPAEVDRFRGYRDGLNGRTLALDAIVSEEGLTLATDELLHWAHWITPEAFPKRFDTHFFLTRMPHAQEAAHDQLETTEGVWVTPEDALARFEQGEFPIVFATIHQLRDLCGFASAEGALSRFAGLTPRTVQPVVVAGDDGDSIIIPDQEW